MEIVFRPFIESDRNEFFRMVKKFYAPPATLHTPPDDVMMSCFDASLQTPELVKGIMFEADKTVAGYAIVSLKFETEVGGIAAWIEELFVEEEFRNMGLGKSFFAYLQNEMQGKIKRIRLEVGEDNHGAIRLYKNLGFEFLDYRQMVLDKEF